MRVERMGLEGPLVLVPKVWEDGRGVFFESYNRRAFADAVGADVEFLQDNHSRSRFGVLRGLHYQLPPHAQGKLVRVAVGEIYDVVVDIRRSSPTFGRWEGVALSASNRRQIWVPPGFAHGFMAVSLQAECLYKTTGYYAPEHERCIAWNDPDLAIAWPVDGVAAVSARDAAGTRFRDAEVFP